MLSAGEGPPPSHLALLAPWAHSRAPQHPSTGQLFAWQNLFVFGAVTCQSVSSWPKPFPRGLGDREGVLCEPLLGGAGEGIWVQPSREQTIPPSHLPAPTRPVPGGHSPGAQKGLMHPCADLATAPDLLFISVWWPEITHQQLSGKPCTRKVGWVAWEQWKQTGSQD